MKIYFAPQFISIFSTISTTNINYFRETYLLIALSNGQHKICSALLQARVAQKYHIAGRRVRVWTFLTDTI
jgi:hypothetical protein